MAETIQVAFIFDDAYSLCTGVAVFSLFQNRNPLRNYHVYLIAHEVSPENQALFLALNEERFSVEIIDVSNERKHSSFSRMRFAMHVSTTALIKFELPQLIKKQDKLLYLDGDVIVRDSLEALYDMNIEGKYAAVCKDLGANSYPAPFQRRLNTKHAYYFNSGVMLLNLKLMRQMDLSQKLIQYKLHGLNDFMDQDAFNIVFEENVVYFSFLYNMLCSCWLKFPVQTLSDYYSIDLPDEESFYTSAKILHLCTPRKPWKYYNVAGSVEWFRYLIDSPFRRIEVERTFYKSAVSAADFVDQITPDSLQPKQRVENPKISVVIPVYNSEKYLINCVESLMSQTFQDIEMIFVDDGSSDSSLAILKKYAALDHRIQIHSQTNQFAGVARNNGLDHASGKYVAFLDSDDIMLPTALASFFDTAEKNRAEIVISSAYHFCTDAKQRAIAGWCLNDRYVPLLPVFNYSHCANQLFQITGGAPWGKLYLLSFLKKHNIRFPALSRSEDFLFVYWALAVAQRITTLPCQTILYRIDNNSGSLESGKDKTPIEPIKGSILLYEKLVDLALYSTLRRSFLNNLLTRVIYNINGFQTSAALNAMYTATKDRIIPLFGEDLHNSAFFYDTKKYEAFLDICNSESSFDYVFSKYMKTLKMHQDFINRNTELSRKLAAPAGVTQQRFAGPWIVRKIRGGVQCYKDHGMRYSIKHLIVKIKRRLKRKDVKK